jgi:hypothetical protein
MPPFAKIIYHVKLIFIKNLHYRTMSWNLSSLLVSEVHTLNCIVRIFVLPEWNKAALVHLITHEKENNSSMDQHRKEAR